MTMAQKCLKAIRQYLAEGCGNEWQDVIVGDTQWPLDEEATEEADPSGMSDIAIFEDGSRLVWSETGKEWVV